MKSDTAHLQRLTDEQVKAVERVSQLLHIEGLLGTLRLR